MIIAKDNKLEVNGTFDEVMPEFLAIYKVLEEKSKEQGKNFRSLFLSMIFDAEFEKIQLAKNKSKIINFNDIKKS